MTRWLRERFIRTRRTERARRDRGTAATEVAFAVTIMLGMTLFVVGATRITTANGEVQSAARSAARAAAGGRSAGEAHSLARRAAENALSDSQCNGVKVSVKGFAVGGVLTATVSCTVQMGSTGSVGFGATRDIKASASERVDALRGD